MGFFGTYEYTASGWSAGTPEAPSFERDGLWVDIHDSDIAVLVYSPPGPGTGTAFVGYTPRSYFDAEEESEPTDPKREALGLATWADSMGLRGRFGDIEAWQAALEPYLASDDTSPDDKSFDDEADVFVELKTAQLLVELGLPLPPDLAGFDA